MVEMFMGYGTIKDGKLVSLQSGHFPQVLVGLDASKPTPAVGDYYIATDTGKNYTCYINGTWSLGSSPAIEEYSNHLGTTDNIMEDQSAALGSGSTNSTNHRYDMTSGTSVGRGSYFSKIGTTPATTMFEYNCIIQNIVAGNGTARQWLIGILTASDSFNGALFERTNDNSWRCYTNNIVADEITNISALSAGDILTIKGMKNIIQYFVNGSIVATHTTIDLTGLTCYPVCQISQNDVGTFTAAEISCDYISWKVFK